MCVLLVAETECILFSHYAEKVTVRPMVHFPIYRWFLAFLFFAVLRKVLDRSGKASLPDYPLGRAYLAFHLGYAFFLNWSITPLWKTTNQDPALTWLWIPLMTLYPLSWLATVIPPPRWRATIVAEGLWLAPAIVGSGLTVWAGTASIPLWEPLASATLWCSSLLLEFFLDDLVLVPGERGLGTSQFQILIGGRCSGSEGIGLITGYVLCYLFYRRKTLRFPNAFWLIPLGAVVIWLANIGRLVGLVLVGAFISPATATKGFHSQAGWIAFSLVGVGLTIAVEKFGWFRKEAAEPEDFEHPSAPFVLPLATLLFTWMLSQALSDGFDTYYPLRILVVAMALLYFRRSYTPLFQNPSLRSWWIGIVVYVAWIYLVAPDLEPTVVSPWGEFPPFTALCWLVIRIVGAVVVIPLVEELAFRGFLIRRLQARDFDKIPVGKFSFVALLVSSLAFGLLHKQVLAGTVAGLAYGYATRRNGGLTDAVVAHGTTNLCLAFHVLFFDAWGFWS